MDSLLKTAMDKRNLARKILNRIQGIHYSWCLHHYKGDKQVSAKHALIYESQLGIPRWELRPDFWDNPYEKETEQTPESAAITEEPRIVQQ